MNISSSNFIRQLNRFLFLCTILIIGNLAHATCTKCTTSFCECEYGGQMDNGGIICNAPPSKATTCCANADLDNAKTTCGSWCNSLSTESQCKS